MSAYRLHEVLVAPARPTSEIWRLALAIVFIIAGFLVVNFGYFRLLGRLPDWKFLIKELETGTTARALWLMLGNFLPLLIVLTIVAQLLNGRSLASLAGPRPLLFSDLRRVLRGAVLLFVVFAIIPSGGDYEPVRHMDFASWIWLVPISLPLIFLQISTEEFLFRGYLQSQLAARFSSPIAWMVLPSALFGLLHYDPVTYGENAIWLACWSGAFGLAAADLTARTGNLGAAMALHFVNNTSAMMFTAMQDHWDGLALYVLPFSPEDTETMRAMMPVEGMVILCGWLVARLVLRR